MKSIFILTISLMSSFAGAVELHLASNHELLAELDRRLHGGVGTTGARAIYSCDSSSRLSIELFNEQGQIKKVDHYLGDQAACDKYVATLTQYKARISQMTLIAFCDTSSRLHRYPLKPDGTFGQKTDTYIGDQKRCQDQAYQINVAP